MKAKRNDREEAAAFVMEDGDRFHSIISSGPIRYDAAPDCETILTFFVIRRASGLHDVVHVIKTFKGDECVSRQVQSKLGIGGDRIKEEIAAIMTRFAGGIRKATGLTIQWDALDLADIAERQEQIRRIQYWGRLGVRLSADLPAIGLN